MKTNDQQQICKDPGSTTIKTKDQQILVKTKNSQKP